jgi:hypothetical protein
MMNFTNTYAVIILKPAIIRYRYECEFARWVTTCENHANFPSFKKDRDFHNLTQQLQYTPNFRVINYGSITHSISLLMRGVESEIW